jgi:hypothetical protein
VIHSGHNHPLHSKQQPNTSRYKKEDPVSFTQCTVLHSPADSNVVELTIPPLSVYSYETKQWTIPAPARVKNTHYDIVLGISTKNMDMDAVEAIVVTIHHNLQESLAVKSEVSKQLRKRHF